MIVVEEKLKNLFPNTTETRNLVGRIFVVEVAQFVMLIKINYIHLQINCASLDRIDSSKGYIKGNVQFVSLPINYMKSTKSDIEIRQFLKQISSYTSHFCEDETISSPKEVLGAQAGN